MYFWLRLGLDKVEKAAIVARPGDFYGPHFMPSSLTSTASQSSATLPLRTALLSPRSAEREQMHRLLLAHPSIQIVAAVGALDEVDWSTIRLIICDLEGDPERLLGRLCKRPPNVDVILISADSQWAAHAYEADAVDFLVKPVEKARLSRTIRRLLRLDWSTETKDAEASARMFVPFDRGRRLVSTDEICAIQAIGNYTQVRLAGGATEVVMRSLRGWEESLATGAFLRIHRSTLANTRRIRRIEMATDGDGALAELDGLNDMLAVSRRLLPAVRAALTSAHP